MPIMIAGNDDPTWIESEMRENRDAKRNPGGWDVGGVRNKTLDAESELNLMV